MEMMMMMKYRHVNEVSLNELQIRLINDWADESHSALQAAAKVKGSITGDKLRRVGYEFPECEVGSREEAENYSEFLEEMVGELDHLVNAERAQGDDASYMQMFYGQYIAISDTLEDDLS